MSIISSPKKCAGATTGTGTGIGVIGAGTAVIGTVIGGKAIGDLIAEAGTAYSIPASTDV
jgi:hypothetical protein